MILELNVKDLALIREACVELSGGLNILTGETGAGKSIVIGSIALLRGKKAQPELIREGAEYAYVELIARPEGEELLRALSERGVEPLPDGTLILSRKIGRNRSVAKLNGESVPLAALRETAELLTDLYGQHEYQTLLDHGKHLGILDSYGRKDYREELSAVSGAYGVFREAKKRLSAFRLDEDARLREMDFAAYEIAEIERAALRPGEEEELAAEYKRMNHARKIAAHLGRACELLSESGVGEALSEVSDALLYDETLSGIRDQLCDAESIVSGAARDLQEAMDALSMDEGDFRRLEERLDLIRNLMAKYGNSAEAVEAYRKRKEARLLELQNYEAERCAAESACREAEEKLFRCCAALTEKRRQAAELFCDAVREELLELGFSSVRLGFSFRAKEASADGADEVCLEAALNPGEAMRSVAESASGGELSRVMLAVKTVLAETDSIPTLIFDEIDTGISGRTAQKVAEKLSVIARRHQVICITHLPQIASMADVHFRIEKAEKNGRNVTSIERLSEEETLSELARLLGGAEITEAVRQNAAEMKALARKRKRSREAEPDREKEK